MGIDVIHSLLVGADYSDLEDFIEEKILAGYDGIQEVLEAFFTCASPYYDASREDCFYGYKVPNYHEVNDEWVELVLETSHQFELHTGVKAKIRGGENVW
jgi:hypothetical protein